jgi:hypothetical protein
VAGWDRGGRRQTLQHADAIAAQLAGLDEFLDVWNAGPANMNLARQSPFTMAEPPR